MPEFTVGERILLHLYNYRTVDLNDYFNIPWDITQDGISTSLRISRAHASLELKKQKEKLKEVQASKEEEIKKGIEAARPDIEKHAAEKALADVSATLGQNAEDINRLEAEIEKLEATNAKLGNTALMEFKVYVDQLQDVYFRINDLITEQSSVDEEVSAKMQAALQKIVEAWRP